MYNAVDKNSYWTLDLSVQQGFLTYNLHFNLFGYIAWKGVRKLRTEAGEREVIFINESAVYKLAFRSNKESATCPVDTRLVRLAAFYLRIIGIVSQIATPDNRHFIGMSTIDKACLAFIIDSNLIAN